MQVGDLVTRDKAHSLHGKIFGTIYDKKPTTGWGNNAAFKYKVCWHCDGTELDEWWCAGFLEVVS